jgi:hypothetical protein
MIIYTEIRTGDRYYDTTMLHHILKVSKSKLKRDMLDFGFKDSDYLIYNNRFLIKEEAVIVFVSSLIEKWAVKEMKMYKRIIQKLETGK